jgi:hypothetical protein
MSYYKIIDGKKMDGKIIDLATQLVQGVGDGRLSIKDADLLLKLVIDGNTITSVEEDTIDYVLKTYHWTAIASDWFNYKLKNWRTSKLPVQYTVAELRDKHFSTEDVLSNAIAKAERKHALQAATLESGQDHDEIGLWIRLSDGTTVEVFSDFIDFEGEFVELKGGCIIPIKAIEKVEV